MLHFVAAERRNARLTANILRRLRVSPATLRFGRAARPEGEPDLPSRERLELRAHAPLPVAKERNLNRILRIRGLLS